MTDTHTNQSCNVLTNSFTNLNDCFEHKFHRSNGKRNGSDYMANRFLFYSLAASASLSKFARLFVPLNEGCRQTAKCWALSCPPVVLVPIESIFNDTIWNKWFKPIENSFSLSWIVFITLSFIRLIQFKWLVFSLAGIATILSILCTFTKSRSTVKHTNFRLFWWQNTKNFYCYFEHRISESIRWSTCLFFFSITAIFFENVKLSTEC